jgi:exodeoxyribonuclease-5
MPTTPQLLNPTDLENRMTALLPFTPTQSQQFLLNRLSLFVTTYGDRAVFVVNGYAGTGKTSLLGAFVKALASLKVNTVLLAPTGRAAKVFASFSTLKTQTIHKRLYRVSSPDPSSQKFFLAQNRDCDTIFVVDEASMIGDNTLPQKSLLMQLLYHVFSGRNNALILIGDNAQLPPVGQPESPAMNLRRLSSLGFNALSYLLDEPVRQSAQSGILYNANLVRKHMTDAKGKDLSLMLSPFDDIIAIPSMDMEDYLTSSWSRVGQAETLIITRSNKRATMINNEVRGRIMYADTILQRGEQVLIAKNNYYWTRDVKDMDFIANGETAIVQWMGREHEAYGYHFADAELLFPGKETPVAVKILLDSITEEAPAMPQDKMTVFYNKIFSEDEGTLSERIKAVDESPYYNAVQVKHSYCVTCHKAQGGQWKHVYIDMGAIRVEAMDEDFYRWLYTAITRATQRVYLINPTIKVK